MEDGGVLMAAPWAVQLWVALSGIQSSADCSRPMLTLTITAQGDLQITSATKALSKNKDRKILFLKVACADCDYQSKETDSWGW